MLFCFCFFLISSKFCVLCPENITQNKQGVSAPISQMWKFGGVIRLLHCEAKGFSRYIVTIIISLSPHNILPFLLEFGHRYTKNDHLVKTKLAFFATKLSFTLATQAQP